MAITYRVLLIERHDDGTARIVFQTEYMSKAKQFDTSLPIADTTVTDAALCTEAWQLVKNDVQVFITEVSNGTYLNGASFVPQEDGSLIF